MKAFNNYNQLATELNVQCWEVIEAQDKWIGHSYMYVGDIEIKIHVKNEEIHYVLVNEEDDADCKQYIMTYEIFEYDWKVYVDDIEGWQPCAVIDISNTKLEIDRAVVRTTYGTQINRMVKFVIDEEDQDFKQDGCIYFMEKQ